MIGNLFTADFLERGVKEDPAYRALDDAALRRLKAELSSLYAAFPVTMEPNEAETESRLIYPICDALGWTARSVLLHAGRAGGADHRAYGRAADRGEGRGVP
jgi:hypothetical protein